MSIRPRHRPRETKRTANRHRILNVLFREGTCSRLRLARQLNINASTIGNYVDDFLARGLLQEDFRANTRRGRSPVSVWLNPSHGGFLGVDLEALRVRAVFVDFAGEAVAREEVNLHAGISPEEVLEIVVDLARRTASRGEGRTLYAVGVAAPGRLDLARGRIVRYGLLPDFRDVPLIDRLRPNFECPIYMEENVRALTLAELLRGAGRGHGNFLCLVARSGCGLGIVNDGRIYTGHHGMAGKVGQTVFPDGGHIRTVTEMVSAKGIVSRALEALRKAPDSSTAAVQLLDRADELSLADLADAGDDPLIQGLLEEAGRDLGLVASNLANLFAPETIVLAGEVPTCSPILRASLEDTFTRYTVADVLRDITLTDAALCGFAGALGAAYLGFLRTFPEEEIPNAQTGHVPVHAAGA